MIIRNNKASENVTRGALNIQPHAFIVDTHDDGWNEC